MKLHLNTTDGQNAITSHAPGQIAINGVAYFDSLIVLPTQLISPWKLETLAQVCLDDFAALFALKPELIIFGSGKQFRFPDARIAAAFAAKHIGFDVMDTAAACRTYNVLMGEGRLVAAALIVE